MYSKQEASQLKQEFWTSFGQYMRPVPSAGGERVNWVNYKTGIRHLAFRMNAENNGSDISIEISHPDEETRLKFFDTFSSLKTGFEKNVPGNWIWERTGYNESGKIVSRISVSRKDVNIYRREDWPVIISFLKSGITGLDRYWAEHRDIFEML